MARRLLAVVAVLVAALVPRPTRGEVVRVVVDRREALLGGRSFGAAGAYEKIVGRILFAFDPDDPANAAVVDLRLAPRNTEGRVEVWSDFLVLQPVDPQRRRGVAWFDVGEGGWGRTPTLLQGATEASADPSTEGSVGDGLLLQEGVTLVWVGWETTTPTLAGGRTLQAPVAREADGSPVTGWVRLDWVVEEAAESLPLTPPGQRPYPVAVPEAPVHVLTERSSRDGPRDIVPRDEWGFVFAPDGQDAGRPVAIERDGGFRPGRIYDLVYRAQDPRVVGVGLAVVRDVMSYSLYDLRSLFPTRRGVAFGVGGGARFLRQFLREGFNVDEDGRRVFEGIWLHGAGAGRGSFNGRFAQPGRSPEALRDFFHPVDLFPFTLGSQFDPVTGRDEGLLDRLSPDAGPRTLTTHSGHDYWGRAAALTHTSVDGLRDVEAGPGHRIYHLASAGGAGAEPGGEGVDVRPTLRALAVAMVRWIADDVAPPPSRLPSVGGGSLVPSRGVAYPAGPAIPAPPPAHLAYRPDYGPRFLAHGVIDREPPELGPAFPAQVPQVDGVGNELGGIRGLDVRVPLATFLPWDVRDEGPFAGEARPGGRRTVPLPLTDEEGEARGDHRPSLQHLYGSEAGFLARVRAAAAALVGEGFLLEADREAAIAAARSRWLAVTAR